MGGGVDSYHRGGIQINLRYVATDVRLFSPPLYLVFSSSSPFITSPPRFCHFVSEKFQSLRAFIRPRPAFVPVNYGGADRKRE